MKKTISLISLTITLLVSTLFRQQIIDKSVNQISILSPLAVFSTTNRMAIELVNKLQPELVIPRTLPSTIQDPKLMAAWIYLYNQQERIQLWDGSTLSGQQLAQFVLDNQTPVEWGTNDICQGNSCVLRFSCQNEQCPIYITASLKDKANSDIVPLAETLAHEIFHHTEPFGYVKDTRFEEFLAFYVASRITKTSWVNFDGYDPLNPACVKLWFVNHHLTVFNDYTLYPRAVTLKVHFSARTCPIS